MSTTTLRDHATLALAAAVAFWAVAALLVLTAHRNLEAISPAGCLAVKVVVIIAIAFAYMRLAGRDATIEQALTVGIAWAILSIAGEIIAQANFRSTWYPLLGSPARIAFRNVLLLAWIGAPTLFARRRS